MIYSYFNKRNVHNPATETVMIEFAANRNQLKGSIQLIDLTGKVIHYVSISQWQKKYLFPVNNIRSGLYFIRYLDDEGHMDIQKLIINQE